MTQVFAADGLRPTAQQRVLLDEIHANAARYRGRPIWIFGGPRRHRFLRVYPKRWVRADLQVILLRYSS